MRRLRWRSIYIDPWVVVLIVGVVAAVLLWDVAVRNEGVVESVLRVAVAGCIGAGVGVLIGLRGR